MTYRCTRYRLIPGSKTNAVFLAQSAGACRYVWNHMLAEHKRAYQAGENPSCSFFSMGKDFVRLRRQTDWMRNLHCATVRYSCKRLSDALTQAVKDVKGFPKFKARRGDDYFTIPDAVKIRNGKLWIPKCGWMVIRRNGGDPYNTGEAKQVTVKRELGKLI